MKISIRRQNFTLNCPPEDEAAMRRAVTRVEENLARARRQFGASDSERAALIAAITLAFEAEKSDNNGHAAAALSAEKLAGALKRIDEVLARSDFSAKA